MISLIKGGAFDEMMDRKNVYGLVYLGETCDKKKRLNLRPSKIQKRRKLVRNFRNG